MVKMRKLWIFLVLIWLIVVGTAEAAPTVDASIDSIDSQAHYPLEGTITITHKKEEKIDPQSFQMEGKKLDVSFARDILISAASDSLIAIYTFQLPPQEKGLYLLPEISVKIEGRSYQTIASSYTVNQESQTPSQPSSAPSPSGPLAPLIFKLEAEVKGPTTLYPGERTQLFYRISYNRSIDLTKSILPMIHPPHFQKVGDVQIKDYQEKDVTVQDLTQEVEASEIGVFQFGPSVIEGYSYKMKGSQKEYDNTLLRAEAPSLTVEVKPFPTAQAPPSFSGALGIIRAESSLETSGKVFVGDTLELLIKIEGIENLTELHLPLLQCQPGISGFFQTSDLPPLAEVKEKLKLFHVELRPMSTLIKQIPPLELSSFDPATGAYVIQTLPPIPITVEAHPVERTRTLQQPLIAALPPVNKWPDPTVDELEFKLPPVQLEKVKSSSWINTSRVFWLLPLGLLLLFLQIRLRHYLLTRPKPKLMQSETLLRQGLKEDLSKSTKGLSWLEQAFWQRLWEKGRLREGSYEINQLIGSEEIAQVPAFIYQLQALQYSSNKEFDETELKQTAKQLFKMI